MKPADRRVREMLRLKCRSPRSASLYEHVLVSVGDLTKGNVANWWAKVNADGLADGSIRTYYAILKSVCRFLSEEHRDADAAQALRFLRNVNLPMANTSVVRKVLTDSERAALRESLPAQGKLFVDIARYTGLRVSTLISLGPNQLLQRRGEWWISVRTKRGRLVELPIPRELGERLRDLPTLWFTCDRFAMYRMLRRAAVKAGIDPGVANPHSHRRKFVTAWWDISRDLISTQKAAGHASPVTTAQRYIFVDEAKSREYLKSL